MESPNTSSQAVKLNPSCSGQAHPNRPGTSPGHKNTEPERIFTVFCIPFMICLLRSADAKSGKVVRKIPRSWHKWASRSNSLGEYLRTHLRDHTRYDQGSEIHDGPGRVSLPVSEAQLVGCLKVWAGGPLECNARIQ